MLDRGDGPGFGVAPLPVRWLGQEIRANPLQGHHTPQAKPPSAVDDAHATLADFLQHLVALHTGERASGRAGTVGSQLVNGLLGARSSGGVPALHDPDATS